MKLTVGWKNTLPLKLPFGVGKNPNAFMFAQIIRDPASPTEEVSVFDESLQIAFSNKVS